MRGLALLGLIGLLGLTGLLPAAGQARPAPKMLNGPGVIRCSAQAPVRTLKEGETGVVTFPIPGTYREQVPLSFQVFATPASALKSYRWYKRPDGRNWLCDVTVAPGTKGALVRWEALVLVGEHGVKPLPKAAKPEVPDAQTAAWTYSTACVQSGDAAIRAKAEELAKGTTDLEAYARRVIAFTQTNKGTGARFDALDARSALDCGGSCTSRANLAAALLRARGIPARTMAHLPTWAPILYEHWLVEYWHPGVGWVWLESSRGEWQPQPWTLAVLNVANPEDEDKAFDPLHLRFVMPGAAHLSVAELSKELYAADLVKDDAMNFAEAAAPLNGTAEEQHALHEAATKAYAALTARCEKGVADTERGKELLTAAKSGSAARLTAALEK